MENKPRKKINISQTHYKILRNEFKVSHQTVYVAVNYWSFSAKAKAIRKRAIELLQNEISDYTSETN